MAHAPQTGDPAAPPANAVECIDCDTVYDLMDGDEVECPEEPLSHGAVPLHVTDHALGFDDDADYYHPRRTQWEYPGAE